MPSSVLFKPMLACLAAGMLLLAPSVLLAPSALASTGGTALPGDAPPATTRVTPPVLPGTAGGVLGTAAGGSSAGPNRLQPPAGALPRRPVTLHGELTSSAAHRRVVVQLLDPRLGWTTVARSTTDAEGNFTASWRAQHVGRFNVRAVQPGTASASAVTPMTVLEVLKPVRATWFGPDPSPATPLRAHPSGHTVSGAGRQAGGQPQQLTACGEVLTTQLLGVAHRTLPCGTMVDITYAGRGISVPVVDRGPYVRGVTLDLTQATAQALGFDGLAYVGALAVTR